MRWIAMAPKVPRATRNECAGYARVAAGRLTPGDAMCALADLFAAKRRTASGFGPQHAGIYSLGVAGRQTLAGRPPAWAKAAWLAARRYSRGLCWFLDLTAGAGAHRRFGRCPDARFRRKLSLTADMLWCRSLTRMQTITLIVACRHCLDLPQSRARAL